jgi:hypothetical protein
MTTPVPVTADTLESALEWTSSGGPFENQAFLSRTTGELFFQSAYGNSDDDLPDDLEDGTAYIAVPHKNDLDLGRELVLEFARTEAPAHLNAIENYFRQRGAYAKFKSHLERTNLLEHWFAFEAAEKSKAIEAWAVENGFVVVEGELPI